MIVTFYGSNPMCVCGPDLTHLTGNVMSVIAQASEIKIACVAFNINQ